MSTTNGWRWPHREAASARCVPGAGQTGNGHGQVWDEIACLDVLAGQMHARGWTAYVNAPAGRVVCLFVQDPHGHAECGDIVAAPDGSTGDWWYWFVWAERIRPVHTPAAAADAIIRALRRPADSHHGPV